jgi:hypothetical protein
VNVPPARHLEGASVDSLALWVQTEIKLGGLTGTDVRETAAAETAMEEFAL